MRMQQVMSCIHACVHACKGAITFVVLPLLPVAFSGVLMAISRSHVTSFMHLGFDSAIAVAASSVEAFSPRLPRAVDGPRMQCC